MTKKPSKGSPEGAPPKDERGDGTAITLPGRKSRADELYEDLRSKIFAGRFAPDERLVEETIAKQASVSRTPVREAFHRLEMDGLVKSTGRGLTVVDTSSGEMAELCTAREGIEGFAARLAATAASEMELEVIKHLIEVTRQAVEAADVDQQVELNHRFHETIWQACGNGYLMRQLEMLRTVIERRGETTLKIPERQRETLDEHTAIYEAIKARDADAAESATKYHFRRAMSLRLIRDGSRSRD